jgi:hypothetical protein
MRACAAVLFVSACTHHRPVATLLPVSASDEATAQLGDGRDVKIHAAATPAGAHWVTQGEVPDASGAIVETAHMRSYTTVSHGRGALEGVAIGAASGALLGAVTGLASGDDHCAEDSFCLFQFTANEKAVLGGVAFGGIGLALGALLGAMIGSRDVYEIDPLYMPRVSTTIAPGRASGGLSWSF